MRSTFAKYATWCQHQQLRTPVLLINYKKLATDQVNALKL